MGFCKRVCALQPLQKARFIAPIQLSILFQWQLIVPSMTFNLPLSFLNSFWILLQNMKTIFAAER
jgi:hypothetical protein